MTKFFIILFFSILSLCAKENITAVYLPGDISDINATSKAWISADEFSLSLYSIDSNISKKITISIKPIYSDDYVGILITTPISNNKTKNFFISTPCSKNTTLPYVNGGNKNGNILVVGAWQNTTTSQIQNSDNEKDNNQTIFSDTTNITKTQKILYGYISNGTTKKALTQNEKTTFKLGLQKNHIFFIKKIKPNSSKIILSFNEYKKDNNQTIKYISKWTTIYLKNPPESSLFSSNEAQKPNINNGREIFIQNCIACHRYNNDTTAPKGIAPMLTNIGGYANKTFIVNSLLKPNSIINPKFEKAIEEKKITPMPSFSWLDKKSLNDLVYFLQNLKAK